MHRTAPTRKNGPAPNVTSAEVEKSCDRATRWINLKHMVLGNKGKKQNEMCNNSLSLSLSLSISPSPYICMGNTSEYILQTDKHNTHKAQVRMNDG